MRGEHGAQEVANPTSWVRYAVPAAAALVAFALAPRWSSSSRPGQSGALIATERTTHSVYNRGTAVLESGAALSWTASPGRASVSQSAGNVFYRSERGGKFEVATPLGRISTVGNSFRVELVGVGALFVTIYQGTAQLEHEHGVFQLEAGQVAEIRAGSAPVVRDITSGLGDRG